MLCYCLIGACNFGSYLWGMAIYMQANPKTHTNCREAWSVRGSYLKLERPARMYKGKRHNQRHCTSQVYQATQILSSCCYSIRYETWPVEGKKLYGMHSHGQGNIKGMVGKTLKVSIMCSMTMLSNSVKCRTKKKHIHAEKWKPVSKE